MSAKLEKVLFELQEAEWHSAGTETLWATPLLANEFRLENSPFYARGYSFEDVVFAQFDSARGFPVVQRVVRKSGRSTYALRVIQGIASNKRFLLYWEPLEKIGCTYENADGVLLIVDVPAQTRIHEAYRLLEIGEHAGVWEFQEQNVGHAV